MAYCPVTQANYHQDGCYQNVLVCHEDHKHGGPYSDCYEVQGPLCGGTP